MKTSLSIALICHLDPEPGKSAISEGTYHFHVIISKLKELGSMGLNTLLKNELEP